MNPIIFPPTIDKIRWCPLALVEQPIKEKEHSEFKPVKLRLKTEHGSHPVRVGWGVKNTMGTIAQVLDVRRLKKWTRD